MRRSSPTSRVVPLGVILSVAVLLLSACGGGSSSSSTGPLPPPPPPPPATKGKYFTHIVIVIQENRSFDNLFATFPGADGTTIGKTHNGTRRLRKANLDSVISPSNGYKAFSRDYNGGKMNGFDTVPIGHTPGTYVYEYVDPSQIRPYWQLAKRYVLSDHTFQTQGSGSFTGHQDLIRGGTALSQSETLIDFPNNQPWGCDAPAGTVTTLITRSNHIQYGQGPFPCFTYETLADPLDAKGISWRYYSPSVQSFAGGLWSAFDAIQDVRHGADWSKDVASPETVVFDDIKHGTVASVSWIVPDFQNSDHPGSRSDTGPSWVAQIVNAIGESPIWDTTAIVIVWDDWGGWYDHVRPPGALRFGGLGFRVPMIVVSPYAKPGLISHASYQFGSIVRFVEDNWDLGRLGTSDVTSRDFVGDFFDFKQSPRKFRPLETRYSQQFFRRQPPSNEPVDSE